MSATSLTHRILVSAVAIATLALAGCDRQSGADKQPAAAANAPEAAPEAAGAIDRSHRGSHLPALRFRDGQGHEVALAVHGRPLLVNLWATWCGPCVAELPSLARLAAAGKVEVVAISQDTTPAQTVTGFWQAHGLAGLSPLLDPQGAAASQWQAASLPTTIYYDAQGREVWRSTGGHDWTGPQAAALLAETAG